MVSGLEDVSGWTIAAALVSGALGSVSGYMLKRRAENRDDYKLLFDQQLVTLRAHQSRIDALHSLVEGMRATHGREMADLWAKHDECQRRNADLAAKVEGMEREIAILREIQEQRP